MALRDKTAYLLGCLETTAYSRLKKSLMVHLATQLGLDICFRCQERILEEKEFSVDHKQSWRLSDTPRDTFFDVNNLAFSHLACNIGAAKRTNKRYESELERKRAAHYRYYSDSSKREHIKRLKRENYKKRKEAELTN